MRKRILSAFAAVAVLMALTASPALAHIVGEPGTPSCFGERISHGSSNHKLTPAVRAQLLGEVIASELSDPELPDEERELILSLFGDDGVSVREMTRFVRIMCDEPLFPPPEES